MRVCVERIPNKPIDSNSFVIYVQGRISCAIIDPGTEDCLNLIAFIESKKLKPEYVFLTHEHFDHIWGVNKLKDIYNCKIVCSNICSTRIIERKKNLSIFYNQIGFETYPADTILEKGNELIKWNGIFCKFIVTEGHSEASVCILIDNKLFTGDTIIKGKKTVTKLPGGSKPKLIVSISNLDNIFLGKHILIHPGHGESFWYDEKINQHIF